MGFFFNEKINLSIKDTKAMYDERFFGIRTDNEQ